MGWKNELRDYVTGDTTGGKILDGLGYGWAKTASYANFLSDGMLLDEKKTKKGSKAKAILQVF